jgi:hypothetical protein
MTVAFGHPTHQASTAAGLVVRRRAGPDSHYPTGLILPCPAALTAVRTFSTEGLKNSHFLATVRPSTKTFNSPLFPFTNSTSTPGSFRKVAARLAA